MSPEPAAAPEKTASGLGLGPVRVASAVDEVSDRLLTAIALGEFSVGERLPPERELAEQLGVSRPTVRSAVARLREVGCLEVLRGRTGGHYVRSDWRAESATAIRRVLLPRWERTAELLDTRCLIESLIARTAAERRTDADLLVIRAALAGHDRADEPTTIRSTDAELHRAIAHAAGNSDLLAYSQQLLRETNRGFAIEPYTGRLTEQARADHHVLVDAIAAGDAGRAGDIAREHFRINESALRATLDRGLSPG